MSYCQILCSENSGSGGGDEDSVLEFATLKECHDSFVAVEASPAFLCRLSELEHHRQARAAGAVAFGAAMT